MERNIHSVVYPNAKINIGLRVLERRPDGFHNLESLFYPIEVCDTLEIIGSKEFKMVQYGITYPGDPNDNICAKAYNLLNNLYNLSPVEIHLFKNIPVGAGLGGGSSDAAFTLITLNNLFNLNLSQKQIAEYAAQLGSDCPFFVYNSPMLGEGRGELLSPVSVPQLAGYEIRMVYPPIFVSTADAYRGIVPQNIREQNGEKIDKTPLKELLQQPVEQWRDIIVNDFETTVFAKYPELIAYKEQLYKDGAVYASMSGSGSAMFGLFERK